MNDSLEKINHTKATALPSKRLKLAALLGTLAAFAPLSIDMYLPALPHIAEELHTTPSLVQLSLTFFMLGLAFGQLLVGPLSDAQGRRTPLLIGLAIYSIASLLCAFSPNIWVFITLRFIQGLSGAAGIVLSRAIVRDIYSGVEMTKFFSLLALVNGVAPILAPVLGASILLFVPWQGVFIVLSVIGVVMVLFVLFSLPETLQNESRSVGGMKQTAITFKQLLFDRSFIGFALAQALVSAVMFAYIAGSSFVLQNMYGTSPQVYSLIFAMNGVGIVIASQITGRLAGRVSVTNLFVVGISMASFGSIALLILLLLNAGLSFILVPLFLAVSSVGIVSTTGNSLALENQGKIAGSASALLGLLQFLFGGMVAPLTGLGTNPAISMGIVMTLASIAAVLSFAILVRRRKQMELNEDSKSESM
ncbi:multidrug effflux MFS transporter [Oceanobacillus salinisoli]|uniref:multidrug effflux MFS transporter n=1 Tax=Oceanobacillus salinisoli TaxID=2678611 RepID=UPI0012E1FAC3|nr:multidrug effflux MFS transporter [Oceanobacillus salinisoli]